jgi:lysozyme
MAERTLGIDVSHYQSRISWLEVASSNVKFAYAKATEGSVAVDGTFAKNWHGIQEAGLFRGAYHFARPGQDAETQAVHFHSIVGALGFRDLPPMLDLEVADGHEGPYVLGWARRFLEAAEHLFGRKLLLYTGQFWKGPMGNPTDAYFGERKLWLAAYRAEARVVVPRAWDQWTIWQYSDGSSNWPTQVRGVAPCDQNWFAGSEQDLQELCIGASPVPAQPPVPAVTTFPGVSFVWPRSPAVEGVAVQAFQERLRALGFALDADGVFGPQSKRVTMAFQREQGLAVDGIVGKKTWDAAFGGS